MDWLKDFRHTASKCKTIKNAPQKFVGKYIFGIDEATNDNMIRGNVSGDCAYEVLNGMSMEDAIELSVKMWNERGGQSDTNLKFAQKCIPHLVEGIEELQLFKPTSVEGVVEGTAEQFNLKKPIYGRYDLYFEKPNLVIDYKSTKQIPKSLETANEDDIDQQGLYWKLTGEKHRFGLLYASSTNRAYYEIPKERLKEGFEKMYYNMQFIENLSDKCDSKLDWLLSFPLPNYSSFYYSNKEYANKIKQLYKGVLNNG